MKYPHKNRIKIQKKGIVYLIHETNSNYYKIGITTNLKGRLATIASDNPHEIEMIFSIKSPRANHLEHELHDLFDHKNYKLEWFIFYEQDIPWVIKAMTNGQYKKMDLILPLETDWSVEEAFRRSLIKPAYLSLNHIA